MIWIELRLFTGGVQESTFHLWRFQFFYLCRQIVLIHLCRCRLHHLWQSHFFKKSSLLPNKWKFNYFESCGDFIGNISKTFLKCENILIWKKTGNKQKTHLWPAQMNNVTSYIFLLCGPQVEDVIIIICVEIKNLKLTYHP